MTPWEAVEARFGMDEKEFRGNEGEVRSLLAFWIDGEDVGGYCTRGVDFENAGGIDVLVRLNAAFLQMVVKGFAKGCTPSFDAAKLGPALDCVREALEEDGAIEEGDDGVLHPSESFQEANYAGRVNDEWQVRTLGVLLDSVFGNVPSVEVDRRNEVGGAPICSSCWTEIFVWTTDETKARKVIDERIARIRELVDRYSERVNCPNGKGQKGETEDGVSVDEASGGIDCPYCGSRDDSCSHVILTWSACNGDWEGGLAVATNGLQTELIEALWVSIKVKGSKAVAGGTWESPLSGLVSETTADGFDAEAAENCDWYGAVRSYLLDLGSEAPKSVSHEWDFDGGWPGSAETFGNLYAAEPSAAIGFVVDACKRDIGSLRRFAASSGPETKPGSAGSS